MNQQLRKALDDLQLLERMKGTNAAETLRARETLKKAIMDERRTNVDDEINNSRRSAEKQDMPHIARFYGDQQKRRSQGLSGGEYGTGEDAADLAQHLKEKRRSAEKTGDDDAADFYREHERAANRAVD